MSALAAWLWRPGMFPEKRQGWYDNQQTWKAAAAYLGCTYLELRYHPQGKWERDYALAAMEAEAMAAEHRKDDVR